jgi:hypothetical protein
MTHDDHRSSEPQKRMMMRSDGKPGKESRRRNG